MAGDQTAMARSLGQSEHSPRDLAIAVLVAEREDGLHVVVDGFRRVEVARTVHLGRQHHAVALVRGTLHLLHGSAVTDHGSARAQHAVFHQRTLRVLSADVAIQSRYTAGISPLLPTDLEPDASADELSHVHAFEGGPSVLHGRSVA